VTLASPGKASPSCRRNAGMSEASWQAHSLVLDVVSCRAVRHCQWPPAAAQPEVGAMLGDGPVGPVADVEGCEAARKSRSVWRDSIIKSTAIQPARVIAAAISRTMDSTAKGADDDSVNPNRPTLMLTIKPARMPITVAKPKRPTKRLGHTNMAAAIVTVPTAATRNNGPMVGMWR
jgi:hypothetical protein